MSFPTERRRFLRARRGQLWVSDLLAMTTFLLLIFLLFFILWNTLSLRYNYRHTYVLQWSRASDVTDMLVSTPGYPYSWERLPAGQESSIQRLGLAYSSNALSPIKLARLANWTAQNYTGVRDQLGLAPYDFYATVVEPLSNTTFYSWGQFPSGNVTQVTITRMGVLNGTVVQFTVNVWQ